VHTRPADVAIDVSPAIDGQLYKMTAQVRRMRTQWERKQLLEFGVHCRLTHAASGSTASLVTQHGQSQSEARTTTNCDYDSRTAAVHDADTKGIANIKRRRSTAGLVNFARATAAGV